MSLLVLLYGLPELFSSTTELEDIGTITSVTRVILLHHIDNIFSACNNPKMQIGKLELWTWPGK